jgi:TonB-linked SusC/RagA family outer membrane protein
MPPLFIQKRRLNNRYFFNLTSSFPPKACVGNNLITDQPKSLRMQPMLLRNRLYRLLSVLLLSLTCFYSSAQAIDHRVTINGTGIPLKTVFKAIKKQTGFAVMYNTSITMLNQEEKVTVSFKDTPLDEVLTFLLKGRNLAWTYNEDVVVIYKKAEEAPKKNEVMEDSTVTPALLTGKVTDAAGSPLPGVTVHVKGSNQGTTTDGDGNFTLAKVKNGEVLVISSVGYERREIAVKGRSLLAQLNVQVSGLDETVVIAYGLTTRRMLVGNVSTVKGEDIAKQPVNNPLLALQGRVPGLFITQNTGVAGGSVTVRIQGQNSISNGNDPLYIIDGVPYASQLPRAGGENIIRGGNPLNFINVADIESIEILKDADATAIYGSRAANGAIFITTKKGKAGRTAISINLQQGWGKVTRQLDMLDRRQYLDMRYEGYRNDNIDWRSPDVSANDLKIWDTTRNTDWQKTLIGGTAQYSNINVGISGGNTAMQYTVGGTYHRETTVFPGNAEDKRGSLHFAINSASSNKKLRFQLSGNYMVDDNRLPVEDITFQAIRLEPVAPTLYNTDGSLNWAPDATGTSTWINPLSQIIYNTYKNKTNNLVSNAMLSYTILPGLDIQTSAGYSNTQTTTFSPSPLGANPPEDRPYVSRYAVYGNRHMDSWIMEPQIIYKTSLAKGKLESIVGTSIQQNKSTTETINGMGYNSDLVLEDIKSATTLTAESSSISYKYNALFGRINYTWQDKYIINLTGRRDGSSRFGAKNRFHNFGSIGLAWIFSEESWIQKKLPSLSFGKLRASYGTTGNDQIDDYGFLSLYYNNSVGLQPYQNSTGLVIGNLANPYLQWEETQKWQFGVDLGFWNDRILLNTTYARNRSSNQLLGYKLPSITGFSNIVHNFPATIQNTSWEFSLNSSNIKREEISWHSSINFTIPQNKLLAFPDLATSSYRRQLIIGQPLGTIKVFHFLGVDPATGLYQVADSHGSPTSSPDYLTDRTILLSTMPKFYGGFQNRITYRGIELDFLFQFVKQTGLNVFFNNGSLLPGAFKSGVSNQPVSVVNRWQRPEDIAPIMKYSSDESSLYGLVNMAIGSDAAYTDASYIRLKNLSLSWQIPLKWQQKAHLQNCKIYIQGQNLLTITNYRGMDPENQSLSYLPPLRIITVGVQIGL